MDEDLSSFMQGVLYETIGNSEKLFGIFFRIVVKIDIQVVEVFISFGILLWSHIKNMGDSCL